ncbi:hypothetical protein MBLNU459_g4183t1 [Dothideomycetes sp. NU459]
MSKPAKVYLFDIGGVCVVSPFQAILDYEVKHGIPPGWVNHSIQAHSPDGSWQRLERGEIPLDTTFFAAFQRDLTDEPLWRKFYARHLARTRGERGSDAAEEAMFVAPPPPQLDAEWLYWEMMRVSRAPDPHMYPALRRLRAHADEREQQGRRGGGGGGGSGGKGGAAFLIGALSNTSIWPEGHEFNDPGTPEGRFHAQLRSQFDVFVSSAHVGMRKPNVDIYEYAIRELDKIARERGDQDGVKAEDIVFLDDIGGNLRTAKQVGMRTIKVQLGRADIAVKELERVSGLALTGDVSPKL